MRIALVILHADPARGGAERYTLDLAAALAQAGHDVSLLAMNFAQVPAGVGRVELSAGGMTRAGRYTRMLDALDLHLQQNSYDIVHAMLPVRQCDVYHPHAGLAVDKAEQTGLRLALNRRRKLMAEVEGSLLTSSNPPIVLSLSEYVKREITRHYPELPQDRLATLFNAVDLTKFESAPSKHVPERVNALFIGQDFQRKGLVQVLAAMSKLRDERLGLTVVGKRDGRFHWPHQQHVHVSFAGETDDPQCFYRDADLFVLPTRHDPCSLVVLEALAMGLPVISTRFNGACEIMTEGVHGFVLDDPDDVNALAEAMRKMLDPELRARMSKACLDLRPQLSYENHLRSLLSIYQRIVEAKRSHEAHRT